MPTKNRRNHGDSEKLRKFGFEFEPPVDEYSEQPDSSSTIGGLRGKQEYGIADGASNENVQPDPMPSDESLENLSAEDVNIDQTGTSEFYGHITAGEDVAHDESKRPSHTFHLEPRRLEALIRDRLSQHESIDSRSLSVSVTDVGTVMIEGVVSTDSQKLRAEEVIAAIPGVGAIDNRLAVRS